MNDERLRDILHNFGLTYRIATRAERVADIDEALAAINAEFSAEHKELVEALEIARNMVQRIYLSEEDIKEWNAALSKIELKGGETK